MKPAESEIDDRPEIEILKDKADPDKCDTDVVKCGGSTAMGDDGDYFDEVILGRSQSGNLQPYRK